MSVALPVGVPTAFALTQVSNLAEANTVNFSALPPPAYSTASSFTTDAGSYTLGSLTLSIHSNNATSSVGVRLRADSGGQPGALIENLGIKLLPAGTTQQTYSSTGTILAANTTYWVTAGESGSGSVSWTGTFSTAETSPGGWTIGDQCFNTNNGTTWNPISAGPPTESCLFSVDATGIEPPMTCLPQRTFTGAAAGNQLGWSVASAGDVNGDGHPDLVVSAPVTQDGTGPGQAFVYFGGPGADDVADLTFTGEAAGDGFGFSVGTAGDVNGDGNADVIVGAWLNDAGGDAAGRAYVYYGGPGADVAADLTLTGAAPGDEFGISVATAGDVNGDSYADVIVGARSNDAAGIDAGRAYVYYGGPGADAVADLVLTGEAAGDNFGRAVASARDMNGDGYADLIVGAYHNDAVGANAGRAYVFYGGPGADTMPDLTLNGEATGDLFGNSVASAGDVNGDGRPDLIVGAQFNGTAGTLAGRAYVYYGGPGADNIADLTFTSEAAGDWFGFSVASAGDVNGDGRADLIVGAPMNDAGGTDAGRSYVYYGGPGADTVPDMTLTGDSAGDKLGHSVAPALDVFGNGHAAQIVGAPAVDPNGVLTGRAYLLDCGSSTTGVEPTGPVALAFLAPWPNPARGQTSLAFDLESDAEVTVSVYDLSGRRVARPLTAERLPAGRTVRSWRPEGLPSGAYWLRARIGEHDFTRALIWLAAGY